MTSTAQPRAHGLRLMSGRDPNAQYRVATPLELLYDLTPVPTSTGVTERLPLAGGGAAREGSDDPRPAVRPSRRYRGAVGAEPFPSAVFE